MRHPRSAARLATLGLGSFGLLASLALMSLGGAPPQARAQTVDAATLHHQQAQALNAGNVVAVMATFNDDAVYQGTGLCAQTACIGKAAIQKEIERQVADRVQVATISRQVSGASSSGRISVRSHSISAAGVERIIATDSLEVKNNRFSKVQVALDLSDHQTSEYRLEVRNQTAGSSASAATGSGAPFTGSPSAAAAIRTATAIPPANAALTPIPAANIASTPTASTVQVQPQVRAVTNAAPSIVQLPNVGSGGYQVEGRDDGWLALAAFIGASVLSGVGLVRKRRA